MARNRTGASAEVTVVVVGSNNFDLVAEVVALPTAGETVLATGRRDVPGGKGANQAAAAARAGAAVRMCGAVGSDEPGDVLAGSLASDGVDCSHLARVDGTSGMALIAIDAAGENQIVVLPGANATVDAAFVDAAITDGLLDRASVVLAPLETPLDGVTAAFQAARRSGARTILNTAPPLDLPAELLANTSVLIANETEIAVVATACAGFDSAHADATPIEQARAVAKSVEWVVVTLGGHGLLAVSADREIVLDAYPIEPIDTVGAGDAFCGGFAAALADGADVDTALRRANATGALTTLATGARTAPTRDEVDRFLAAHETNNP